jgi:peptidyl-prolyl cis-trans isomerase SurA
VYAKLQGGEPFAAAAMKYSEDPTTAKQGGRLAPFGINQMLPEFEDAAFSLTDDGTYSAPFKTKLGWHIVQRVGRNPLPGRQEAERQLAQKIRRDERSNASQKAYVDRLKREYRFDLNEKNLDKLLVALEKGKGVGKAAKLQLATYNGTEVVTGTAVLAKLKKETESTVAQNVAYARFQEFTTELMLAEAERQLPVVNAEFRYLAQEYREGILVFELTREKVWDKAAMDTLGLKAFFADHRANYQWPERITGSVLSGTDAKSLKKAADLARQGVPVAKIQKVLNVKSEVVSVTDAEKLALGSEGKNARQAMLGQFTGPDKVKGAFEQNGTWFVLIATERIPAGPKELSECRGQVIADYQKHLESEWMKELATQFPLEMLGTL